MHTGSQVAEIPAFDPRARTVSIAGPVGVDVLDVETGKIVERIDTSAYGLAALAVESNPRTLPGSVVLYDTRTRKPAPNDPPGTVSVIDVETRAVVATAGLAGGKFEKIGGLGVKDFKQPGNQLDPHNDGTVAFITPGATDPNVKGLYMPDTIATYSWKGRTLLVMANEGDFREDDGDRSAASNVGTTGVFANLRTSNTDSSPGNLFVAGARSFSIRDADGHLIYDSSDILDKEAHARGKYDDGRSRDKGVEPEGMAIEKIEDRTCAFVGLERTTSGVVAVFDITDPYAVRFLDMIVTPRDVAPEGLAVFKDRGDHFRAIANESSNTTTLYRLTQRGGPRGRP